MGKIMKSFIVAPEKQKLRGKSAWSFVYEKSQRVQSTECRRKKPEGRAAESGTQQIRAAGDARSLRAELPKKWRAAY